MKIELGDEVRDTITGFEGIAVGRSEWLYGCMRIAVEPRSLGPDGMPRDVVFFDVYRLEKVYARADEKASDEGSAVDLPTV